MIEFIESNEDYLVINKPSGVLTQGPAGVDSLETRLLQWKRQTYPDQEPYIGVPHRLDRPVSGAMVFGQDRKRTRRLAEQFQNREVKKYYWALINGHLEESQGRWSDFMRKVPAEARSEIVDDQHPDAQLAILSFEVLGSRSDFSLVKIELETGRTHQIRLQFGSRGFPLLGDELYGSAIPFGPQTEDLRSRAIALHSRELQFYDHRQRVQRRFAAPVPRFWLEKTPELTSILAFHSRS